MKKIFVWLCVILLPFLLSGCDSWFADEEVKTIADEYRGKWEVRSFKNSSETDTEHILPCTVTEDGEETEYTSGGFEIGDTWVKTYLNGGLTQEMDELYTVENAFYSFSFSVGLTVSLDNLDAVFTTTNQINYCEKTLQFSWE